MIHRHHGHLVTISKQGFAAPQQDTGRVGMAQHFLHGGIVVAYVRSAIQPRSAECHLFGMLHVPLLMFRACAGATCLRRCHDTDKPAIQF